MSYQKSKGRASGTTLDVFKRLLVGALHAVEEIQKNRLLSEVTKVGAFFVPNLGN